MSFYKSKRRHKEVTSASNCAWRDTSCAERKPSPWSSRGESSILCVGGGSWTEGGDGGRGGGGSKGVTTAGDGGRGGCSKGLATAEEGGDDGDDEDHIELLSQSGTLFFTMLVGWLGLGLGFVNRDGRDEQRSTLHW